MTSEELNRAERAERSYPKPVRNNAPEWIAGVILGAIIGIVAYESAHGTRADAASTRDVAQVPVLHAAKP
jgi:hypothetical protein